MKTVEEKLHALAPEFLNEVRSLTPEQVNARIVVLAKNADEVEESRDADETLENAKVFSSLYLGILQR